MSNTQLSTKKNLIGCNTPLPSLYEALLQIVNLHIGLDIHLHSDILKLDYEGHFRKNKLLLIYANLIPNCIVLCIAVVS